MKHLRNGPFWTPKCDPLKQVLNAHQIQPFCAETFRAVNGGRDSRPENSAHVMFDAEVPFFHFHVTNQPRIAIIPHMPSGA